MGEVNELQPDRAFELLKVASLERVKVVDKKQTACIKMVTPLTAKELNKLFQFLQEDLCHKDRLLSVESDEVVEHLVNVFGTEASTKSFV